MTFSRCESKRGRGPRRSEGRCAWDEETDAERLAAVIKALTGWGPGVCCRSGGGLEGCYGGDLEGFMRYVELVGAIAKRLGEVTGPLWR
jgi:hypothetical protein